MDYSFAINNTKSMYVSLLISLVFISMSTFADSMKEYKVYIESSIKQDVFYYFDFEKNEIPENKIYFQCKQSNEKFIVNSQSQKNSNYIAFYETKENGNIKFEVFMLRNELLNKPSTDKYTFWKEQNSAIVYEFVVENNELVTLIKGAISYE